MTALFLKEAMDFIELIQEYLKEQCIDTMLLQQMHQSFDIANDLEALVFGQRFHNLLPPPTTWMIFFEPVLYNLHQLFFKNVDYMLMSKVIYLHSEHCGVPKLPYVPFPKQI